MNKCIMATFINGMALLFCWYMFHDCAINDYVTTTCDVWDFKGPMKDHDGYRDFSFGRLNEWRISFWYQPVGKKCKKIYDRTGYYTEMEQILNQYKKSNTTQCYHLRGEDVCRIHPDPPINQSYSLGEFIALVTGLIHVGFVFIYIILHNIFTCTYKINDKGEEEFESCAMKEHVYDFLFSSKGQYRALYIILALILLVLLFVLLHK